MNRFLGANCRWSSLLAVLIVAAAMPAAAGAAEIEFVAVAQVRRPVVRLGDVARITGSPAQVEQLRQVELGPAPPPGQRRLLRTSGIRQQLWRRGFAPAEHVFRGASVVEVVRVSEERHRGEQPGPEVDSDHVREQAARRIADLALRRWFADAEQRVLWDLELALRPEQAQAILQARRVSLAALQPAGAAVPGGSRLPVSPAGELVVQVHRQDSVLPLRIAYRLKQRPVMVVAATGLARGTVLQRRHLRLAPLRRGINAGAVATELESVLGWELTRAVRPGEPIPPAALQRPVLVRRGDVVDVVVVAPGVRLRTRGRARSAGAQGDLIEVESLLNRKTFFARVVDVQTVQVQAAATAAGTAR